MNKRERRFVRLASARIDVIFAHQAYNMLCQCSSEEMMQHFFNSMVTSYCRPFTENHGLGSLFVEYHNYPDFSDAEMNLRHSRMIDIRNKFLSHSSIEGTWIQILPPNIINPITGKSKAKWDYNIAKRQFVQPEQRFFIDWLAPLLDTLANRLDNDIENILFEIGKKRRCFDKMFEIETGAELFNWTIPNVRDSSQFVQRLNTTKSFPQFFRTILNKLVNRGLGPTILIFKD